MYLFKKNLGTQTCIRIMKIVMFLICYVISFVQDVVLYYNATKNNTADLKLHLCKFITFDIRGEHCVIK
jgi:hypothetical protein